jgi:hypothetical protein
MKRVGHWLLAWLMAVISTSVLGSVVQSQLNLARIVALGGPVTIDARLSTTWHDLVHFAPAFAALVATGFLIAFPVVALIVRKAPRARVFWHALAGATAIATALLLMQYLLGLQPVAAARDAFGLAALAVCGAIGGWVQAGFSARPAAESDATDEPWAVARSRTGP